MNNWEKEKERDYMSAFTRILSGEPADGGYSEKETREILEKFRLSARTEVLSEIAEKCKEEFEKMKYIEQEDYTTSGERWWKMGESHATEFTAKWANRIVDRALSSVTDIIKGMMNEK
jgi:DNA gyrase/topoisomerase IV subunit A